MSEISELQGWLIIFFVFSTIFLAVVLVLSGITILIFQAKDQLTSFIILSFILAIFVCITAVLIPGDIYG